MVLAIVGGSCLVGRLLQLVDAAHGGSQHDRGFTNIKGRGDRRDSQLLEVAVGYVVAAPVGDGVELDAVRELHGGQRSGGGGPTVQTSVVGGLWALRVGVVELPASGRSVQTPGLWVESMMRAAVARRRPPPSAPLACGTRGGRAEWSVPGAGRSRGGVGGQGRAHVPTAIASTGSKLHVPCAGQSGLCWMDDCANCCCVIDIDHVTDGALGTTLLHESVSTHEVLRPWTWWWGQAQQSKANLRFLTGRLFSCPTPEGGGCAQKWSWFVVLQVPGLTASGIQNLPLHRLTAWLYVMVQTVQAST